jgi:hypothetical protein
LFLFMLIDAGFFLKTHDFLQPLESPEEETSLPQQPPQLFVKQHALPLPGGVGTFSIRPAPVVKEEPPLVLWGQPTTQPGGQGAFFLLPCTRALQPIHRPRVALVPCVHHCPHTLFAWRTAAVCPCFRVRRRVA